MTDDLVPPEVWADEGRRVAPALEDVAAAIITGRDAVATADVALGIARAHAGDRRVVVADLVGGLPALTPLADQPGLLECLRDGEPLSEIGQPLGGADNVYVLPSGRGAINERWVFESARWARLVAGFREVDALLLLVCAPSAPGLSTLMDRVDGVVAVDLPPADVRAWPLLATVDHPEPELPPIPYRRDAVGASDAQTRSGRGFGAPHSRRRIGALGLTALGLAACVAVASGLWFVWGRGSVDDGAGGDLAGDQSGAAIVASVEPAAPTIEVTLGPPVNPADSARSARFAVELVAANTPASANSALVSREGPFPAATVAPVLRGASSLAWYLAISGAWTDRDAADDWLATERSRGVVRSTGGRVVDVPFALLLGEASEAEAERIVARWASADVRAYGLRQDDGSIRVYAGAFETAGQAVWLASMLRDAGEIPRLAYRTGRMF